MNHAILKAAVLLLLANPSIAKHLSTLHAWSLTHHEVGESFDADGHSHFFWGDAHKVAITITSKTVLIAHTHTEEGRPQPSPNDVAVAIRTGIPDVVISPRAEYIVYSDGVVEKLQ